MHYCLNWSKFNQLIHRKIIRIVATRCQIFIAKCMKFDFILDFSPDRPWVAYRSAPLGNGQKGNGKNGKGKRKKTKTKSK